MTWQVLLLQEFDEDLAELASSHGLDPDDVEDRLIEVFTDDFHAKRIDDLLQSGLSTDALDRLHTSAYPPSIRIRLGDLRVTAWLFPQQRHAVVTHIFHKSADPDYRQARKVHDDRLEEYVEGLGAFLDRKRR